MRINKKCFLIGFTVFVLIALTICFLLYNGYIWFNNPDHKQYTIRGIDVSSHQNEIDWGLVKEQNIKFAYIKATEGKDFIDKRFKDNWENARKTGIMTGAYHFFTFRSSGEDQANNFISTVPKEVGSLPPVIDLEFSGNSKTIPQREELLNQLNIFNNIVEAYYGQKPVIYVLYNSYEKYISKSNLRNKIWIRDIIKHPKLRDGQKWTFWQYSDHGRLSGIDGFVDLNVFNGDELGFK